MKLILPPGLTPESFRTALRRLRDMLGTEAVLASDEDRETYLDAFAIGNDWNHAPSAALTPRSTAQIQAAVRIANEFRVPLWPISRGKNLAYGGSAPRMPGTVVLDLSRMQRILEVNSELAYCRVEPGVGFYDLYDHIRSRNLPLWVSVPKQSWGSVVGNALERGLGESPYGDHAQQICGMEVVLPTGELLRTGMGARANSTVWPLFKYGFGPGWDQMFCQSNFGIVSSMGLWLMPQPESTVFFRCNTPQSEDLEAAVTAILNLKRGGVLDSYNSMVSWLGIVACFSQRKDFYDGPGALPEATIQEILKKFDIGWWNFDLALSGPEDLLVAKKRIVEQEMMRAGGRIRFASSIWRRGDAKTNPGEPAPDMTPMQFINWYGGAGGHIDFSPVIPARPADAVSYFRQSYAMFQEAGLDFFAAYHFGSRHLICPTNLIYDRSNTAMTTRVTSMFSALLENASRQGLSEYRTHLSYMDAVAGTFEFNNHALLRLNEKIKDAIDPNGILAPGKSGIWPKAYRRHKT